MAAQTHWSSQSGTCDVCLDHTWKYTLWTGRGHTEWNRGSGASGQCAWLHNGFTRGEQGPLLSLDPEASAHTKERLLKIVSYRRFSANRTLCTHCLVLPALHVIPTNLAAFSPPPSKDSALLKRWLVMLRGHYSQPLMISLFCFINRSTRHWLVKEGPSWVVARSKELLLPGPSSLSLQYYFWMRQLLHWIPRVRPSCRTHFLR